MKWKFFLFFFLLLMPFSFVKATGLELGNNINEAVSTEFINEFSINVSIPSEEKVVSNNVLFVIDGSSVNDSIWANMRKTILESVDSILPYDDTSKNINKVGVIGFGISGNVVVSLTNDKNVFEENLPTTADGLFLGRSASNNEVGLKIAKEYLQSLNDIDKKERDHTIVIYMSDGAVNMSEVLYNYYDISISGAKYGGMTLDAFQRLYLKNALITLDENKEIKRAVVLDDIINNIKNFYKEINSISIDEKLTITLSDMINSIDSNDERYIEILNNGVKSLFSYMGYEFGTSYSVGDFEKMFVKANFIEDDSINSNFLNIFYVPMVIQKYDKLDSSNRAVAEGLLLKEYATIYTIAYNGASALSSDYSKKIMDPLFPGNGSYTSNIENGHFSEALYFSNINKVTEKIEELTVDISKTNYKSLVMTGYTSKWVIPVDVNKDGVFDEKDVEVVTGYIDEEPVIKIEKLTKEELELVPNENVRSNTSEDIYKITWKVTDELKTWDKFKIRYTVTFDENEEGFVRGEKYNVNESVALSYDYVEKDEHGVEVSTKPMEVVITSPVIKLEEENPNTFDDIEFYFVFNIIMTVGLIYSGYYLKRISN